jgi:hypothetical protein
MKLMPVNGSDKKKCIVLAVAPSHRSRTMINAQSVLTSPFNIVLPVNFVIKDNLKTVKTPKSANT